MGIYGPFTATVGQVVKVSGIDPNADRLYIENMSVWPLAVAFADTTPPAVVTLNGLPWVAMIPQGGKLLSVAAGNLGARHFLGTFYVLAVNAMQPTEALSGTVSVNAEFFVQALYPGEPAPSDYTLPQFVNLASQPRVVVLPIATGNGASDNITVGATGVAKTYNQAGAPGVALFPGVPASFNWSLYVTSIVLTAKGQSYGVQLWLMEFDTTGTGQIVAGSREFYRTYVTPSAPVVATYALPSQVNAPLFANTAQIGFQLNILELSAAGGELYIDLKCSVDFHSGINVPSYGGQGLPAPVGAANGVIF